MKKICILVAAICPLISIASEDSIHISQFFNYEMSKGHAYDNLKLLCTKYPHRLSGSPMLEEAIDFCEELMLSYDFDTVYRQEVWVPHWIRGEKEKAYFIVDGQKQSLNVCALGGSIATSTEGLQAEVVMIQSDEQWQVKGEAGELRGKIVFVNKAMASETINAFDAYGACWNVRGTSAISAARYGASAVIIRSLSQTINTYPHTGVMFYDDSIKKIPAMAMSTWDAENLASHIGKGKKVQLYMKQSCKQLEDKKSYNLIAELRAKTPTDKYITI